MRALLSSCRPCCSFLPCPGQDADFRDAMRTAPASARSASAPRSASVDDAQPVCGVPGPCGVPFEQSSPFGPAPRGQAAGLVAAHLDRRVDRAWTTPPEPTPDSPVVGGGLMVGAPPVCCNAAVALALSAAVAYGRDHPADLGRNADRRLREVAGGEAFAVGRGGRRRQAAGALVHAVAQRRVADAQDIYGVAADLDRGLDRHLDDVGVADAQVSPPTRRSPRQRCQRCGCRSRTGRPSRRPRPRSR